jgi:hypothetical protein
LGNTDVTELPPKIPPGGAHAARVLAVTFSPDFSVHLPTFIQRLGEHFWL